MSNRDRSDVLPTDPFDQTLARLIGLPNGAHTQTSVVDSADFYGNVTQFMIRSVRTDEGVTAFVTQVNAQGSQRYILPQGVLTVIDRQRESITKQLRRRIGKRLVEEGKLRPGGFTEEMRRKAAATRRENRKGGKKKGKKTTRAAR